MNDAKTDVFQRDNSLMKNVFLCSLFCCSLTAHAWDFGLKGDATRTTTDNVNLTNTAPINDSYNTLGGYLQLKNESLKFKLKGKVEKYKKQNENDNYSADLSMQYKYSKTNDFTFSAFKQVYNGTPAVITDTTSDNSGARIAATLGTEFNKDSTGYISLNGTVKKYSKIAGRTDKIVTAAFGLENYFTPSFMVNPELNIQNNNSADSYYSNLSYGPMLYFSFTPNDSWEFFVDGSYSYTSYSGRTVTTTVKNRKVVNKEYQELKSADIGMIFTIAKNLTLQAKYTNGKNNSNNTTAAYKADALSMGLGFKF